MPRFPQTFRVRQALDRTRVEDIPAEVEAQLGRLNLSRRVAPGHRVAITAGSRGIANIATVLKATVDHLTALGARPFIVPAMGSHGGGTAEGQQRLIESYGVTEAFCGCPVRSSLDTVVVCEAAEGFPVHFDRHAFEADHVIVCNRVKPHTMFVGEVESGLLKMMLVGLGKREGATVYHRAIQDYSFPRIVESVAREVLQRCAIAGGLALVENGYEETAHVEAVAPDDLLEREKALLLLARRLLPGLPFRFVDVLVVDEMGKNISGTGIDTNVVGRRFNDHKATDDEFPKVKRIAVRSLTEGSHGNALGIGVADFCTSRLMAGADMEATRINGITSLHLSAARMPFVYDTDAEMLDVALSTIGLATPENTRLLWIRNTLVLEEVECSVAYLEEARNRDDLEVVTDPRDLPFDAQGDLPPSMATTTGLPTRAR